MNYLLQILPGLCRFAFRLYNLIALFNVQSKGWIYV
jgi:hypothetical protein